MPELLSEVDKRKHLESLSDEVKQFHPFLEALLSKMPRVTSVSNTHGPNERGADFIIERTDDTTGGDSEFVAVIVKVGKIDKNFSSSGITDQIRECQLARHLPGGKRVEFVHEVWIFTNESITQIGREGISRQYPDRRIKFFESQNIVPLINKHLPNYWFNIPVDIGDYLRGVDIKLKNQDKTLSILGGVDSDFYVDQAISPIRPLYESKLQKLKRDKNRKTIHEILNENKCILIEGEAGFGKSKLLRYVGRYYCVPANYIKTKTIPLYLNYADIHDNLSSIILKLIRENITTKINKDELESCTILVLIDGFDEKRIDESDRVKSLLLIRDEIRKIPNAKALITSRPLNISDKYADLKSGIVWYEIMPMSIKGMFAFLTSLCKKESISSRIIDDIKKSNIFKQLPKSPIAALLLARLLEEQSKDLPSNLTELYLKYTELMLGRWDMERGMQSQKEFEAAVIIITNIAVYFIENNLPYCSSEEAKGFFSGYLNKRNLEINHLILYEKLINRSGIILHDPDNGRITFKHRTFFEFFYATTKVKNHDQGFISNKIYDPYLKNIYFFYVGLQKDCEPVLTEMMNVIPSNDGQRLTRVIFFADYLLAGYMTPYDFIKKSFERMIKELSQLYINIITGKIDTPFRSNPEMIILWLFQAVVRSVYGFEFYKNALSECALGIVTDAELSNEEKAFGVFFISVIGVELKVNNPFDGLLEHLEGGLPLPVQFGIHYEIKNIKIHSKLLNRQTRKLNRYQRESDKGIKDAINNIHEMPLFNLLDQRKRKNLNKIQ